MAIEGWKKITEAVDDIFNHHAPNDLQTAKLGEIRDGAKAFALIILDLVPECADRSAALRKIREAMMTANAAVILKGRSL